jgi:hypothetical protein
MIRLCLVKDDQIGQTVLSFRVFGLDGGKVLGANAISNILKRCPKLFGRTIDAGKNKTSYAYFPSPGFTRANERFEIAQKVAMPGNISVTLR